MARPLDIGKRHDLARRAMEVMRREGVDIPMSTLAQRLEVNRTTLLYYFPTKTAMVERDLEELLTEQATYVLPRMMEHDHPIDQLYAQLRAVHAFHHGREERVVFLSQAIAACGLNPENRFIEIGNEVFRVQREAMRDRLAASVEAGATAPCDADALVRVVRSLLDGLMVQRVMTGCDLSPVHDFIWKHLLAPLKLEPENTQ